MSLTHWWKGRYFKLGYKVLKTRQQWGATTQTLDFLLSCLMKETFNRLTTAERKSTTVDVYYETVDRVWVQLIEVIQIMRGRLETGRILKKLPLTTRSIDSYFTNSNGFLLQADEIKRKIETWLPEFIFEWEMLASDDSDIGPSENYYLRHYQPLIADIKTVILTLLKYANLPVLEEHYRD